MAEIRHFPRAGFPATRQNVALKFAPEDARLGTAQIYCAYNQTRERFVATGVEAVDASAGGADARLRSLEPVAGAGLWILPCVEIAPSSIRFPVDLVYLDEEGAVVETVGSFPLSGPRVSCAVAGSVLVLPANAVAEGEMEAGDRLMISAPEEMMRHLQEMKEAKTQTSGTLSPFLEQFAISPAEEPDPAFEEPARTAAEAELAVPVETVPEQAQSTAAEKPAAVETRPAPQAEAQAWNRTESRGWFARLLLGDPVDPRKATREELPGLIAYFFTGGTPVAHPVRDMSTTGAYIVTQERWYLGTVVRVTLTDRHNPTAERSITVNAKVVRCGADGVGLQFVMEKEKRKKGVVTHEVERTLGVDQARIEEFLRNYSSQ